MVESKTYIATPPGATIKEQLSDRGITQKEFAARMDMSEKHISRLINGEVHLTPDVAERLEYVLGIPASFWNKLESIYREKLAKAKDENKMYEDISFSKKIPYKEMSKFGWVPKTSNLKERVVNLRKFFEVARLTSVTNKRITRIAWRKLGSSKKSDYALMAWAQQAKIEARKMEVSPINLQGLFEEIPQLREMTRQEPEKFCPALVDLMARHGIALVFLPHLGGSFLHGATFYDGGKIVMGLTVRGAYADRFWFSLFHELGHIHYGQIGKDDALTSEDEEKADLFARDRLISLVDYQTFVQNGDFSSRALSSAADHMGIDVGILVERLQKENIIPYSKGNQLKKKYSLSA